MNLTRTNWPAGWNPSADAVNGDPSALIRSDNLRIDREGVTSLRDGDKILGTPSVFASRFYSKVIGQQEVLWTAYGVPVSDVVRTFSYGFSPRSLKVANTAAPSDYACFGDGFGFVFAFAGKLRVKDNVTDAPKPLGLLTPSIANRGPNAFVRNATSISFPAPTDILTGIDAGGGMVTVDAATFEASLGTNTSLNLNTTNIGGGRFDRDIGLDILEIPVTIYGDSLEHVNKIVIDFILDGTPNHPETYANYYEFTLENDGSIQSGEGTRSVLTVFRNEAVRFGDDSTKNWNHVRGVRFLLVADKATISARIEDIKFTGGSGGLNGTYNYIQVDVQTNNSYQAKSPASGLAKNTDDNNSANFQVLNGSVTLTPNVVDPNTTECRFYRMSVGDIGIDPHTGESLNKSFLSTFYYVGSCAPNASFTDVLSDEEVIELNADGSLMPNLYLQTLNYLDNTNGLKDTIYSVEGVFKERMLYLGASYLYLSDRLNPDAIDRRFILKLSGDQTEKNLWIKKVTNDQILIGTTKDLYELTGSLLDMPDGSIDVNIRSIGEAYPPLSSDVCKYENGLFYVAADGCRVTTGSNSTNISPQLRNFFKPELITGFSNSVKVHGLPSVAIYSGIGVPYAITSAHQKIYFQIPTVDGSRRLFVYDTITKTYSYIHADPITLYGTFGGELLASFQHGYANGGVRPSIWILDSIPGFGYQNTQGLPFKLRTVFDANNQPRNRKDTFTLKLVLDTGNRDVSVEIQKDGKGVTEQDETTWISLGKVRANGLTTVYIPLSAETITLGFRYALQLSDTDGVFTFKLYEATIEYEPRPEQLNYLRILPTNLGTVSRKRWLTFAFVIDTLGSSVKFTPYLDNVVWGVSATLSTGTKLTYIFYFDSEAVATDMGGILQSVNPSQPFEFYQINLEESVSEKLPAPATYLVIPANDYGTPNRKRHTSYKFSINSRGAAFRFTPVLDGKSYSSSDFVTSAKRTVDYYFPLSDGDVIGVDIGGIIESITTPKTPFEFYGTVIPQHVETLPDRLEYFRIPNSNFGVADRKRIRTISLVLDTRGKPVQFTPLVDNSPYSQSTSFTTSGKSTVWFYFNEDVIGVDFGGVLQTQAGSNFEFYQLGTPDNVESLPLPVTYYIIPPTDYGTPNRKRHTSYKWQMITRGGRVRFTPILDRKLYRSSIYICEKKQLCEYFFPQRAPISFDDYGDVIGHEIGGILESIENPPIPFEFYEVVVPQKVETLPDRLQYLRIPNTNFGVAARKRVRTIPLVIDTYNYLVRYTPIVDDVLYPPSFHRTKSKTTVHHFFEQDVFGTDFGGILSCEG